MDHFGKKSTFGPNGLRKSAWWLLPDPGFKSKIVKNVYEVHQGSYLGLFINFGLPGGSFCQEFYFLVKIDSRHQPGRVPKILTKIRKLSNRVHNMTIECIKVIIKDFLSI